MNIKKSELTHNLEIAQKRYEELLEQLSAGMIDLVGADDVEIVYAKHKDGWRLWVNVEGKNRFRAYRIKKLHLQVEPDE